MFLFTTPAQPQTASDGNVVDAIRRGAAATGSDFDYLLKTAQRESALDPQARAPTSSATGLFQFIEQTWLGMVKSEGSRFGLGEEARAITRGADGRLSVSDPGMRREILSLREDPAMAAKLAGALTRSNGAHLANALGREPRPADLYVAHFLGARGAIDLIDAATREPARSAAAMFPQAARANPSIFFDREGSPRGAGEVYGLLAAQHENLSQTRIASGGSVPAETDETPRMAGPAFHGLFQSAGSARAASTGAVSQEVVRLWASDQGMREGTREGAREAAPGPSLFFPRADGGTMRVVDSAATAPGRAEDSNGTGVPLPPRRDDLALATRPVPLDLTRFTMGRGTR
jgi:hypothetical protein